MCFGSVLHIRKPSCLCWLCSLLSYWSNIFFSKAIHSATHHVHEKAHRVTSIFFTAIWSTRSRSRCIVRTISGKDTCLPLTIESWKNVHVWRIDRWNLHMKNKWLKTQTVMQTMLMNDLHVTYSAEEKEKFNSSLTRVRVQWYMWILNSDIRLFCISDVKFFFFKS